MSVLAPPTDALRRAIIEGGWLDDYAANRARGLPNGDEGRLEARVKLLESLNKNLVGIYHGDVPVGMLTVESGAPETRTVSVWLYIDPKHRGSEMSEEAMDEFLNYAFNSTDTYRVECKLLQVKGGLRRASDFLRSVGFTQESITKAAVWVDGQPLSLHTFRILRVDWAKQKEAA